MDLAEDTIKELKSIRSNAESEFHKIFENALTLANKLDINISIPRITGRQTKRVNIETNSPESYFRVTFFIPYLDTFIDQLNSRFVNQKMLLLDFKSLISTDENEAHFIRLAQKYMVDLNECEESVLLAEFKLWQRRLENIRSSNIPRNAMEAIFLYNRQVYPSVFKLLQIFATLPVSIASSEMSFSNLKRIKTYLQNTMSQGQLNGVAMLAIHREVGIDVNEVIDELSLKKRRLDFLL
uniref:Repressor of the inhibitor of the protein kinase n=1 Tax=Sipha flava TaxID=143950 RepID=A0A2S2R6P5_9HEMI